MAHLGFLRRDADPHVIKGPCQFADLVASLRAFQCLAVIAAAESVTRTHQRAQRRGHTARHPGTAQCKEQYAEQCDGRQHHLHLAKGCCHLCHGTHQQGAQVASGSVLRHGVHKQLVAVQQHAAVGGCALPEQFCRGDGRAQGGGRDVFARTTRFGQQRDLQSRQRMHVIDQRLSQRKAHHNPADGLRRAQGHGDELVRLAVDQGHAIAAVLTCQRGGHVTQHRSQRLGGAGMHSARLEVGVQQGGHRGTYARTMVFQRRADGGRVARAGRCAKAEIGRQQCGTLAQTLGLGVEQTLPNALADAQFIGQLRARVAVYV